MFIFLLKCFQCVILVKKRLLELAHYSILVFITNCIISIFLICTLQYKLVKKNKSCSYLKKNI